MTEAPSGTVTILFTDIAASTSLTEQLGDAEFRQRARELDTLLRTAISECGGRSVEGKLLGDGVLAVFSSAGRAIECAVRCCALAEDRGLPLHIGLHVGDVLHEGDNVFGGAVNIAARICAASAAGEVLVSDTVRSLARTSVAVQFEDRGQHTLKGIADSLRLFAVLPKEPGGWIDVEARGLRKLWANTAFRVVVAVLVLGIIAGGSAGGLVLGGAVGGSASPAASAYRQLDYHLANGIASFQVVNGDCQASDMNFSGTSSNDVTGDVSGHMAFSVEGILYVSDRCQWGDVGGMFTVTDQDGNTLSGVDDFPLYFGAPPSGEGLSVQDAAAPGALIYTGGTGIYEGATGRAQCLGPTALVAHEGTVVTSEGAYEKDCTSLVALGGAAAGVEPVILQMAAGVVKMAVFASQVDLPKKAYFTVLYVNTRNQTQTGLSLKLRSPDGTEIRAAAREENDPVAGERIWVLPDLASREVGRFVFSMTFLSARAESVDLVAEIDGDGFDPVRSDPLEIEIVQ